MERIARKACVACGLFLALNVRERERRGGAAFVRGSVHWSEQTAPSGGFACDSFTLRNVTDVTYRTGFPSEGFRPPDLYFRDSMRAPIP